MKKEYLVYWSTGSTYGQFESKNKSMAKREVRTILKGNLTPSSTRPWTIEKILPNENIEIAKGIIRKGCSHATK